MLINDKDYLFSSNTIVQQMKTYLQNKGLSKRESEVVLLVVQGFTNKHVANQLCIAEKTVKFHLTNIYKRMNIARRSQIIWTLPVAQFIEHARHIRQNHPQPPTQVATNTDTATKTETTNNNSNIPIGHSTVTDVYE